VKIWLILAGFFGGLAVALGAFAAHGLKESWASQPERLAIFETAARYQMYHALALLAVAILVGRARTNRLLATAGAAFTVGILIFSGSLYALAFTQIKWLGAITPLGGLAFLIGWTSLVIAGAMHQENTP
jgi:uncharacterized membrane protein YgdD (TMEM256/DUF423 family)